MKVLVTGAAGFLGKRVVSTLLERGHSVRAVVRPASPDAPTAWKDRAEIVRADLRVHTDFEALFDGVDVLVHLAATVSGSPESQFVGSVVCTERLLEGMGQAGSTQRVVLASSFAVYDWSAAHGSLTEESSLESRPYERDGYTVAKLWQERVARRLAESNRWTLTVLRPGFIYGPGAVPVAGAGLRVGNWFVVIGPMTRLPLTHVDNCAAAFADAAEKSITGTFNIVDDEQVSTWRYAGRLLATGGSMRLILPYGIGLAIAYLARLTSRILFPPNGGKLPEILVPRRYHAVFKPLRFENRRVKDALGWTSKDHFASGCDVT